MTSPGEFTVHQVAEDGTSTTTNFVTPNDALQAFTGCMGKCKRVVLAGADGFIAEWDCTQPDMVRYVHV